MLMVNYEQEPELKQTSWGDKYFILISYRTRVSVSDYCFLFIYFYAKFYKYLDECYEHSIFNNLKHAFLLKEINMDTT